MDLTIIAGPLIGAVIGYFTNYLAVKMLFRPRREIKIGSKTLPFTPGVIPKGKPRLARVIGRTVADTLVTGEDIRKSLLSDSMQEAVADKAESILQNRLQTAVCRLTRWDDKEYETTKEKVCDKLSQEIYETVLQMPLQEKISESMLRYAQDMVRSTVKSFYAHAVEDHMDGFMQKIDLASLIEDKINAMDVMELENMVLSVMKKELNTIVNLGALIGFVIGILNIFI